MLMTENSRLKLELDQAIKKVMPASYITQDVARDCIDVLKSVGMGRKRKFLADGPDSELRDMIVELRDNYEVAFSEIGVYKREYERVYTKFQLVTKAIEGADFEHFVEEPIDKIISRVMNLRGVLETIAIRLERWQEREPELNKLRGDVLGYLEEKRAQ